MSRQYDDIKGGAEKLLSEIFCDDTSEMPEEFKSKMMESVRERVKAERNTQDEESFQEDLDFIDSDYEQSEEVKSSSEAVSDTPITELHDRKKTSAGRFSRQWTTILSLAAVFVFVLGGTLLTRGKLRSPGNSSNSSVTEGQIVTVITPYADTSIDESSVIETGKVSKPQAPAQPAPASFLQDMWLFIKAAAPYLGSALVGAGIAVFFMRKKKE